MSSETTEQMKRTWDALARRNAMHYIATGQGQWSLDEFLASGIGTVNELLDQIGNDSVSPDGTVLDLGCGLGRVSIALSSRFSRVIGVDVSEEMVAGAQRLADRLGRRNIQFTVNNGRDLQAIADGTCDLVFSYIMLQHVPHASIALGYIGEMGRVTKTGGLVLFHVPVYKEDAVAHIWRATQTVSRGILRRLERLGIVPPDKGAAFRGSRLARNDLYRAIRAAGLEITGLRTRSSPYRRCNDYYVCCRKGQRRDYPGDGNV